MTKVTIDLSKVTRKLEEIEKNFTSKELLEPVSKIVITDIQRETRSKKGFDESGKRKNLPSPLSTEWSRYKDKLAGINKTHPTYGKGRSNLTFTGQLLNSLKAFFERNTITIKPTGTHRGYKQIRGGRSKDVENEKIAEGLESLGYKFLGVDDKTEKKIKTEITRFIRRLLRRS